MEIIPADLAKKIRTYEDNGQILPSAIDMIKVLLGTKDGSKPWIAIKKNNQDILHHVRTVGQRGGKVDYVTSTGFGIILANLQGRKKTGKETLIALRTAANTIAMRYYAADETLATEIIEKIDNPEKLEFIAQRLQVIQTQKQLTKTIQELNGKYPIYAVVNDRNNKVITGHTAKEFKLVRVAPENRKRPNRDSFEISELINMQFLEQCEERSLKKNRPIGNDAIEHDCVRVIKGYQNLINNL